MEHHVNVEQSQADAARYLDSIQVASSSAGKLDPAGDLKASPILEAEQALESNLERLEFQAVRLIEKINDVLRPEDPRVEDAEVVGPDRIVPLCRKAHTIRAWTGHVSQVADRLAEAADRVQL